VDGNGSDSDKSAVRTASQFVGAALDQNKGKSSSLASAHANYSKVFAITVENRKGAIGGFFTPAAAGISRNGLITIMNKKFGPGYLPDHPANLARALLHESGHLTPGQFALPWRQHGQLDAIARDQTGALGLGTCTAGAGFPGC